MSFQPSRPQSRHSEAPDTASLSAMAEAFPRPPCITDWGGGRRTLLDTIVIRLMIHLREISLDAPMRPLRKSSSCGRESTHCYTVTVHGLGQLRSFDQQGSGCLESA